MARTSKARAPRKSSGKAASPSAQAVRHPLDDFIAASALVLNLTIEPEWLPAVRTHLEVTLRHAALVAQFPLPDDLEPAPVFEA
jgi:1-carboxybiuret hydrolase subunit AtzG-like